MTVKIYTTNNCPKCKVVKNALATAGIDFEEVDLSTVDALVDLRSHGVFVLSAPIIRWGDRFFGIVGDKYREIASHDSKGLLALGEIVKQIVGMEE